MFLSVLAYPITPFLFGGPSSKRLPNSCVWIAAYTSFNLRCTLSFFIRLLYTLPLILPTLCFNAFLLTLLFDFHHSIFCLFNYPALWSTSSNLQFIQQQQSVLISVLNHRFMGHLFNTIFQGFTAYSSRRYV